MLLQQGWHSESICCSCCKVCMQLLGARLPWLKLDVVPLLLQVRQAKQAADRDKQALEVYRMEGEELAAELRRTQERLTSLQAERIPAETAHHVSAMLGVSCPPSTCSGSLPVSVWSM